MSCKCGGNCKCKKKSKPLKENQKVWWHTGYGKHLVTIDKIDVSYVWVKSKLFTRTAVDVREISELNLIQKFFVMIGLIK